jgi:hypothetical protein
VAAARLVHLIRESAALTGKPHYAQKWSGALYKVLQMPGVLNSSFRNDPMSLRMQTGHWRRAGPVTIAGRSAASINSSHQFRCLLPGDMSLDNKPGGRLISASYA